MPHSLIISDLHLRSNCPETTKLFQNFLVRHASHAEALYILGDLFEYWAGDDDLDDAFHQEICAALRELSRRGTRIFIMHGNRDFLMREQFAAACSASLLPDPALIDLYGTPTLLTHGDALCTDDTDYQAFRSQVRNPAWQQQFLAQPLAQRKALIEQAREQSKTEKRYKTAEIMDVNPDAVSALLRQFNYPRLVHGHTHRPARHNAVVDGHAVERWVLGDWDIQANALRCAPGQTTWEIFPE